ncbi:MAG: hypothetical protein MRK02_05990 [Candidatus Scalindua sp.]|nr:hypothetical protein [Candidatus Scalindua sp.]
MVKFIKQKMSVICFSLVFVSCTTKPYRYDFSLVEPYNETLIFEDCFVKFQFVPSPGRIQVVIKNTTDHDINLVREEAKYVDPAGVPHRIHYGYSYVQEVRSYELNHLYVSPVRIDPDTEIAGFVWLNNWPELSAGYYDRTSIQESKLSYLMEPLFPRNSFEGKGEDLKGTAFKLFLPIDFGGYVTRYTFIFRINDVED